MNPSQLGSQSTFAFNPQAPSFAIRSLPSSASVIFSSRPPVPPSASLPYGFSTRGFPGQIQRGLNVEWPAYQHQTPMDYRPSHHSLARPTSCFLWPVNAGPRSHPFSVLVHPPHPALHWQPFTAGLAPVLQPHPIYLSRNSREEASYSMPPYISGDACRKDDGFLVPDNLSPTKHEEKLMLHKKLCSTAQRLNVQDQPPNAVDISRNLPNSAKDIEGKSSLRPIFDDRYVVETEGHINRTGLGLDGRTATAQAQQAVTPGLPTFLPRNHGRGQGDSSGTWAIAVGAERSQAHKPHHTKAGQIQHNIPGTLRHPRPFSNIPDRIAETLAWFHTDNRGMDDLRQCIYDIAREDRERRQKQQVEHGQEPTAHDEADACTILIGHVMTNIHVYLAGDRAAQAGNFADWGPVPDHAYKPTVKGGIMSYFSAKPIGEGREVLSPLED